MVRHTVVEAGLIDDYLRCSDELHQAVGFGSGWNRTAFSAPPCDRAASRRGELARAVP